MLFPFVEQYQCLLTEHQLKDFVALVQSCGNVEVDGHDLNIDVKKLDRASVEQIIKFLLDCGKK